MRIMTISVLGIIIGCGVAWAEQPDGTTAAAAAAEQGSRVSESPGTTARETIILEFEALRKELEAKAAEERAKAAEEGRQPVEGPGEIHDPNMMQNPFLLAHGELAFKLAELGPDAVPAVVDWAIGRGACGKATTTKTLAHPSASGEPWSPSTSKPISCFGTIATTSSSTPAVFA